MPTRARQPGAPASALQRPRQQREQPAALRGGEAEQQEAEEHEAERRRDQLAGWPSSRASSAMPSAAKAIWVTRPAVRSTTTLAPAAAPGVPLRASKRARTNSPPS